MKIMGLQKATLIDYPGKVACTIFLFGCNFRCGFCHNPELVIGKGKGFFSEENVLDFLKKRRGKLDAVCITGGEPLMSLDLAFIREIKELGYLIKVDTNGSFPEKLREIIREGLVDYIAMDIKSSRENYAKIASCNVDVSKIEESMKLVYDFGNYEFRTTILESLHDIFILKAMGKWINEICGGKPKKFYLQGFKSQEDLLDREFCKEKNMSEEGLNELKRGIDEFFEEVEIRV